MRKQSWMAYGLIGVFLALYAVSLILPGIVFNTPDILHENPSIEEATASLERGAACWTGTGIHLHLDRDHTLADEHGSKLSSKSPPSMACRGQATKTTYHGYEVLRAGWLGAFIYIFAWYANVLALVALVLALVGRTPKTSAWLAGGAFLLGFDAFRLDSLPTLSWGPALPDTVDYLASGYYVWEVAMAMLLLSQIVTLRDRRAAAPA